MFVETAAECGEHSFDLGQQGEYAAARRKKSKAMCGDDLRLELRGGRVGYVQVSIVFRSVPAGVALGDVRRYRDGRSPGVSGQSKAFVSGVLSGHGVDFHEQVHRSLPNCELAIVLKCDALSETLEPLNPRTLEPCSAQRRLPRAL